MSSRQVFSEQEAAEIMQWAVRLQEQSNEGENYTPGVTLQELQRIAEEAGLDPTFIEKAISNKAVVESEKGVFHFTESFERVIDGEINPDDFDLVLEEMKVSGRNQRPGAYQVGRSMTAMAWTGVSQAKVEVSARKGRTRLQVTSNAFGAYFLGLHGPLIGGIIIMALMGERGNALLGALLGGGLIAAGGVAFKWLLMKGHKAAQKLTEKLAGVIADEIEKADEAP
jgi:hypothetical protein